MLPPICSHPACMNMAVITVTHSRGDSGLAKNRAGTKALASTKAS
jgi:hypothetical protein